MTADREREWLAFYAAALNREPEQRPPAARPAGGAGEEE